MKTFEISKAYEITIPGTPSIYKEVIVSIKDNICHCASGNIIILYESFSNEFLDIQRGMQEEGDGYHFSYDDVKEVSK